MSCLRINRSLVAEIMGHPLYRCYNTEDTAKLTHLPRQALLVVMATRYSNPDTVLRMKQIAGDIGAKFIEIAGGTRAFKHWLARTDVEKEMRERPGLVTVWKRPIMARGRTTKPVEGTVKNFIKQYWAETGGSPTLLLKKAQDTGRQVTLTSISAAKSRLIRIDGWIPPEPDGAIPRDRPPVARRNGSAQAPSIANNSAAKRTRQGVGRIGEGLQLARH